ncbi:MAG: thioredoxin-dependent thiol peroxidase [Candidatus Micrarchaeia archaeon]|jgi:peroxiredoxin Q/BCP
MVSEGEKAPAFSLPGAGGKLAKLTDFAGKRLVLYFYPKDDTPGCTLEACGFRDKSADYSKLGAAVVGISPDSAASHAAFAAKHKLPFTLLADEGAQTARRYGAWGRKNFMGREYEGILRTTFVINRNGRVEKVFRDVKPHGHEKEVLAWLSASK